jgi:hypothetical protein
MDKEVIKAKTNLEQSLIKRGLAEFIDYSYCPISESQMKIYDDHEDFDVELIFSFDGKKSYAICTDGLVQIRINNEGENTRCCMCGCAFKNELEKYNPDPYPDELYLNNNSSVCCSDCNFIVQEMRESDVIRNSIEIHANEIDMCDSEKKRFVNSIIELIQKNDFELDGYIYNCDFLIVQNED